MAPKKRRQRSYLEVLKSNGNKGNAPAMNLADWFCRLPPDTVGMLLKYLTLQDLSKMDVALCTRHNVRAVFLQALGSEAMQLSVTNDAFWEYLLGKGVLDWIIARGVRIVSWETNYYTGNPGNIVAVIASGLPHLQTLNLNKICKDENLATIANSGLSNLVTLQIKSCNDVSNSGISSIATSTFPRICSLDISDCDQITDSGLSALAHGQQTLKTINISRCDITNAGITALIFWLPKLVSLNVSGCMAITDVGLAAIADARGLNNLESLDVSGCENITDIGLEAIASGFLSKLISFCISSCYNITDKGLEAAIKGTPNLQSLDISNCDKLTDRSLSAISKGLPELLSLKICNDISGAGLRALGNGCCSLNSLEISSYSEGDITDDVLPRTITSGKLSNLKSLALHDCDSLTSAGLAFVVSKLPSLTSLKLERCGTLGDDGLKAIATSASRQLRTLHVSYCNRVTDAGLVAATTSGRLSNLTSLDIQSDNFTDLGLLAIPNGCPKLVSLNISSHTYTATGLMALIFGLRNLRSVTVNNGISEYIYGEMMRSIATFSPNLRIKKL